MEEAAMASRSTLAVELRHEVIHAFNFFAALRKNMSRSKLISS